MPHLGGDDGLCHCREAGVPRRDRVVVLEVGKLDGVGELVALEEECQDDICLLEHLVAVDDQGVVVQQQRPARLRGLREVPQLPGEELIVLGVHPEGLVEGDDDPGRTLLPAGDLGLVEIELVDEMLVPQRILDLHPSHDTSGVGQVRTRHDVGVEVVVHDRGVLVGTGDAVNMELPFPVGAPESQVGPQPSRLDEYFGTIPVQEGLVLTRPGVQQQGVGDVGVDVVLGCAGRVVGRRLLTSDRAPREQRATLGHLASPQPCLGKGVDAVTQRILGQPWVSEGEHRDDVGLGVPEVVALIARSRHSLGRDAQLVGTCCRLGYLEEVPAHRLLGAGRGPVNLDVGGTPVVLEPLLLILDVGLVPLFPNAVQGTPHPVEELTYRHLA